MAVSFSVAILVSTSIAHAADGTPHTPDWTVSLGLGAGLAPTFEGSDNYEAVPLPSFEVRWRDRVFVGARGLGVNVIANKRFRAGARVGYAGGRDQDDDDALRGLGDVDASVELGLFGSMRLGRWDFGADVRQDVADGHDGMLASFALTYSTELTDRWSTSLGTSLTWASDDYMRSFFGVSPEQSTRSGLRRFDAEGGLKDAGLNGRVSYAITENWSTSVIGRYARLIDDAADSPITQSENQFFVGALVGYSFCICP